jgi:hypothetical protein
MLIGMTGVAGSGKSTVASWLERDFGFESRSFAAPLKESAAALLGCTVDDLEQWKNDPGFFVAVLKVDEYYTDMTVREFLQRYGTESHRDVFGPDFWVNQGMAGIGFDYNSRGVPVYPDIVWSDVRFPNEAAAIRKRAGRLIRIERPGAGVPGNHVSEVPLPAEVTLVNDGTLDELYQQVAEVVTEIQERVW